MRFEFHFCPACGSRLELRQVESQDRPACPECEFVAWRGPQVAVAVVVHDGHRRVLAIRRGIEPGQGEWALPGGYVDGDEDPGASAVRECLEETCCRIDLEELLGVFHVPTREGALLVLGYSGRWSGGEPEPTPEAPWVQWFSADQLPELVFTSHRQTVAAWANAAAGG